MVGSMGKKVQLFDAMIRQKKRNENKCLLILKAVRLAHHNI